MQTFAKNIGELAQAVQWANSQLAALPPLAAGEFYQGLKMAAQITGTPETAANFSSASSGSLVSNYTSVLDDLYQGLNDISSAATEMAQKYTNLSDMNDISASTLKNDMDGATSEFTSMMNANGGSSGSGSGSGSKKS